MKKMLFLCVALFAVNTALAADTPEQKSFVIVNADKCLAESKIGKQETEFLQTLQSKFESDIAEKDKEVKDISLKFNDDYLESLTEEAARALKESFEKANLSLAEAKQQAYQMFHQAKQQIMGKLFRWTSKASEVVAKKLNAKAVLQSEETLYYDESLDVTNNIVEELDNMYLKELEQQTIEE